MHKKTSESLSAFLTFWRDIISTYESSKDFLNLCNDATNDLLHQIELGTYDDRNKFATKLAKVRRERRKYKDYMDINESLYLLFKDPQYIKLYRTLEQYLGQIRKQEKYVETHRIYKPKIIKTLTIETENHDNE